MNWTRVGNSFIRILGKPWLLTGLVLTAVLAGFVLFEMLGELPAEAEPLLVATPEG